MKTSLKICLGALVLLTFKFNAQADGYYSPLNYRKNDPFLFCTKGQDPMKNPTPCWRPIAPYTGEWLPTGYCRPENPYGKNWTNDDYASLAQYETTCPSAEESGPWEGGGIPETSPSGWH
ncbi:hypothetical protein A9K58_10440 [Stenotrophomonas maltophilia]|uniref:Secreted protein n=1 Tax=Stenotrophomonas maltophilia TaxID=40324 RepID=A0A1A6XV81_STEMA|nr:hypothetical protein [Stenotrophomonas maltophilia]OBU66868.1 hypothetical protein A9K58_10440 [Stenotrophomonas maltophilia]